jgi:hypothetical protein
MQGWGKHGVHQYINPLTVPPPQRSPNIPEGFYGDLLSAKAEEEFNVILDDMPRQIGPGEREWMMWEGTDTPLTFYSCSGGREQQFKPITYPNPEFSTPHVSGMWMEGNALSADIVLPVCTMFEEEDLLQDSRGCYTVMTYTDKCIEPIGESKSDWDISYEIAKKLDFGDKFTMGKSVEEWIEVAFHNSGWTDDVNDSWEEFKKKGYVVSGPAPNFEKAIPSSIKFYKIP